MPQDATDLRIRLFVIVHTSAGGHRGKPLTFSTFATQLDREIIETNAKLFVNNCIHRLSPTGSGKYHDQLEQLCSAQN